MKRSILFILVLFIVHANYLMAADDSFNTTIDSIWYVSWGGSNVNVEGAWRSGDIVIPSSITYNGKSYTVNRINGLIHWNRKSSSTVTSITIPSTISSIESGAFGQSTALTAIKVDPANQWFTSDDGILYNKDKTKLIYYPCKKDASHFTIPSSVTTLGGEAFSHNETLTSIVIPKNVTKLEGGNDYYKYGMFYGCNKLTYLEFENSSNYTVIPSAFLAYCSSLTSFDFPEKVTIIGAGAFLGCSSLTSIEIPESVTDIVDRAFQYCSCIKLTTGLPSHIKSIGWGAFEGCKSLTNEILFPKTLSYLNFDAFWGCDSLKKIVIPDDCGLTSIRSTCFSGCNLTDVTLSNNIEEIGQGAFSHNENLTEINLPENLATIGPYAFADCQSLKNVAFHGKLKTIGASAFSECHNLANIILPNSLETVDEGAFQNTSCTTFTIPTGVTSFASTALLYTKKLQEIKVAEGNTAYTTIDGVLFTKDMKTLVTYPIGSDRRVAYQVPYGVETIDEGAIYDSKLTHVTLPSTLKTIYEYALTSPYTTEIVIPSSVTNISRKHNVVNCPFLFSRIEGLANKGHYIYLLNATTPPKFQVDMYFPSNYTYIYVKPSAYANKVYQNADGWKKLAYCIECEIPVTIPASGMKSMGRDFDVDLSSSNITAYVAQGVSDGKTCKQVNMVPIVVNGKTDGKYVPSRMGTITDNGVEYEKYEGVILKGEPGSRVYYTIGEDDDAVAEQTNYLVPATDATKVTMTEEKNGELYTNLGLKNGAFRYFIADGTIPYNKCWLSLPTRIVGTYDSQSGAKAFSMNFTDNEATAIRDLTYPTYSDGAYYTLQGVRVSHPEHGIFIHNGKKVILK